MCGKTILGTLIFSNKTKQSKSNTSDLSMPNNKNEAELPSPEKKQRSSFVHGYCAYLSIQYGSRPISSKIENLA